MTDSLPPAVATLVEDSPDVWDAYARLGEMCAKAGPLDDRARRLVKLALAVGTGSEGAVHSHVRRALDEGHSAAELRHVATLAIPTLGFPAAIAALTWIEDILSKQG